MDTLLVMGNVSEFKRAVQLVIENVSFEQDSTIQVFEASIRSVSIFQYYELLFLYQSKMFPGFLEDYYQHIC